MSDSIFTKIINREIPGHFVYEDEVCVVILDVFPAVTGQSLIIPKQPVDYIFDLDETTYNHLFTVAKKIARASDTVFDTVRTCLVVEGFDVPHVHIKLYPMTSTEIPLGKIMLETNQAEAKELSVFAEQLRKSL